VWRYILRERLEVVPLYFAAERPTVERDGLLLVPQSEEFKLRSGEVITPRRVRFRTLGCWPNTAAEESDATDLPSLVNELLKARRSERSGRMIDHDEAGAMEKKKHEGYF
jgi:sulfate adenylyltransferase subunit 2